MFVRWYRKGEKSDEREESLDEIWRGERRMRENSWREESENLKMEDIY